MCPITVEVDGEQVTILLPQFIRLLGPKFGRLNYKGSLVEADSEPFTEEELSNVYYSLKVQAKMDRLNKKLPDIKLIEDMPQILVNNPSITVYPTRSSSSSAPTINKQFSVSKPVNRYSRMPILSSSSGKSVTVENATHDKSNSKKIDTKEIKNDSKRCASPSTSTRPKKIQKLFDTESVKPELKDKVHSNTIDVFDSYQSKIGQVVKNNSSKCIKTNTATTSTSPNSFNQASLESTSPKLTIKKQPTNIDLNCKVDSTNIDVDKDKCIPPKLLKLEGLSLKMNPQCSSKTLKLEYMDNVVEVSNPRIIDQLLLVLNEVIKENASSEEFVQAKSDYNIVKSPVHEHKRSSETKDSNLKINSNIHNNLNSTAKNQVTCHAAKAKPHRTTKNQQPCTSKLSPSSTQLSSIVKQQVNLANSSPKLQQPNKQNDVKEHNVSSNQQSSPLKHPITVSSQTTPVNKQTTGNQLQINKQQVIDNQHQVLPSNKQLVTNQQVIPINKQTITNQLHPPSTNKLATSNHTQSSTSKFPVLTVTSVPKQLPAAKSSVACQSSQDLKKCKKCFVPSEDDTCTRCRMSASFKGVTLTLIETPGAQLPPPSSPKVSSPIDDTADDNIIQLLSSDEDEECFNGTNCTLEPVIYKTESQDLIKKHIEKLSLNPKLLEDKLWHKDLSTDDYFKFEHCNSLSIGSFSTLSDDLVICIHGIRMTVQVNNCDPVTIDVPIDNIVKILGFYADHCTLIIYTNYLAAAGIQHLLKMKENNKNNYYSPLSKDKVQRRIVWTFELSKPDIKKLEKFLLRFKDKYEPLSMTQFSALLTKTDEGPEDCKYEAENVKNEAIDEHTVIFGDKIDDRTITPLRISDYRMLQIEEFVNDILMEFYLSWWYVRKLSIEDQNRSYLFNSFFYTQLTKKNITTSASPAKSRHNKVKKWTKNFNVFEKDFIFIPINESFHWFMAVICFPHLSGPVHFNDGTPVDVSNDKPPNRPFHPPIESINPLANEADGNTEDPWDFEITYSTKKGTTSDYETDVLNLRKENRLPIKQPCILIFDSLNGGVARARIVATLREWLAEEYKSKYNGAERDFSPASMKGTIIKVPQQPNNVDCGLFVCHYFEKFFERPIVDYHCPITHLENWFPSHDVTKNCQKRRQVQSTILDMIEEKGGLPPNVTLPTLIFAHPQQSSTLSSQQQRFSRNHYEKLKFYDSHNDDDMEEDIDEEEYVEDEDEPDAYGEGSYLYDDYNSDDEYVENDDVGDQSEFMGEMVSDEWQQHQYHGNGSNYNSDPDFEDGDVPRIYEIGLNSRVVNVENFIPRSRMNGQNVNNDNLRSFRLNHGHSVRSDYDDINNTNEAEEEESESEMLEEDEDHNVSNLSKNFKKTHFHQR